MDDVLKEAILFDIPTRASNASDIEHVARILRELKRGGFTVRDGDVVNTVRQWKNTRHPDHIPVTITFSTPEVRADVLFAAAEMGLIGSRTYRSWRRRAWKNWFPKKVPHGEGKEKHKTKQRMAQFPPGSSLPRD